MAKMTGTGTRKSDVNPIFKKQVQEHQKQAKEEFEKRHLENETKWLMPDKNGWDGDLFNWTGMIKPFDRSQANTDFIKACEKPISGVTGDLTITTIQIDYLATMERAFRSRHTMSWHRAMAHTLGRRRGHGDPDYGLYNKGILEYIRGLVIRSSE